MATGNSMFTFLPTDNRPPASNPATFDTRNGIDVLDFDAGTEEKAVFKSVLPRNYSNLGLTVDVWGMATSATSGDVKIGGAIERGNENNKDFDADGFATEQVATVTANGTNGRKFKATLVFTNGANMDSLVAGEPFRFRLARKAADVADTMTGDWEFTELHARET